MDNGFVYKLYLALACVQFLRKVLAIIFPYPKGQAEQQL